MKCNKLIIEWEQKWVEKERGRTGREGKRQISIKYVQVRTNWINKNLLDCPTVIRVLWQCVCVCVPKSIYKKTYSNRWYRHTHTQCVYAFIKELIRSHKHASAHISLLLMIYTYVCLTRWNRICTPAVSIMCLTVCEHQFILVSKTCIRREGKKSPHI